MDARANVRAARLSQASTKLSAAVFKKKKKKRHRAGLAFHNPPAAEMLFHFAEIMAA